MKPSRKHKISDPQRLKKENGELRQAVKNQSQELEQKNRELEIEASLERVRARAMAMRSSSELADLIAIIHREMSRLDKNLDRSFIMLFDKKGNSNWWIAGFEAMPVKRGYYLPNLNHSPYRAFLQGWKKKKAKWTYVLKGTVKTRWDKFIFTKTELSHLPKEVKSNMVGVKVAYLDASYNKYGCILSAGFEPLNSQSVDLLVRFSVVCEQTYTRFLDLKKAEAQAREAQIEAALEKVRSTSLAMNHSDELENVVVVLFDKLEELGLTFDAALIYIFDRENRSMRAWVASHIVAPVKINLPYEDHMAKNQVIKDLWRAKEKGEDIFNKAYSGKPKVDYVMFSQRHNQSQISRSTRALMLKARDWTVSFAAERNSLVGVDSWSGHLTSEEDFRVLKRFSRVFEQAYTRFLDLQKAEAQTREAQIETALEKVRSRSMGMQKSSELRDVVATVFQQLQNLGFNMNFCNIILFDPISLDATYWLSFDEQKVLPEGYHVPYSKHPLYQYQLDAWRNETLFAAFELSGKSKASWDKYISNLPDIRNLSASIVKKIQKIRTLTLVSVATKNGLLQIAGTETPSNESVLILQRFAKVFNQSYTRFLDLQKAEAQAREAHIETALEKVRSRSLAMHQSDEIEKVVVVLFERLVDLGLCFDGAVIYIFDKATRSIQHWVATKFLDAPVRIYMPYDKDFAKNEISQQFWQSLEKGEHVFNKSYSGKAKNQFFSYIHRHNDSKIPEKIKKMHLSAASWTITYVAGENSIIVLDSWTGQISSTEDFAILKRFSRVFEQAFTRFIDLKKAEAQAREARIEGALERIRSKALAMRHSDELKEVMIILYRNLIDLKIHLGTVAIQLFDHKAKDSTFWPINDPVNEPQMVLLPFDEAMMAADTCHRDLWQAMDEGKIIFNKVYTKEQKDLWFDYVFAHNDETRIEPKDREMIRQSEIHTVCFVPEKNSGLFVDTWDGSRFAEEDIEVLKRAARVFEQAYTRFLDLKNAEAQAREAQIEAALERVRSRTMAMHKSEELLEVITVVCEQLQHVGIKFGTVSFGKNSTSFDMDFWVAAPDLKTPIKIYAPYTDISIYIRLKAAYRERKSFFTDTFTAGEIKVWYQHVIDHNPSMFSQKSREYLLSRQDMMRTAVLLKNVILFIINHEIVTYSDEENEIFIRFATVFEQAYTRFLDLQKAEAQARESQIQLALERIRARTMAMQRSSELTEVSQLLHQQFHSLGVQTITCAFMFPNEEKMIQSGWTVLPNGTLLPQVLDFPLVGDDVLNERFDSWKEKKPLHRRTLESEENRRHHQFLSEQVSSVISKNIFTQLPDDKLTFTNANFAQGYLMAFTTEQLTAEEENILIRFAKTFEQTYTRFVDLKRAEAQAREAEIQLALERVRARTMAMQHSNELLEISSVLVKQVLNLGIKTWGCAFNIFDEGQYSSTEWFTNEQGYQSTYKIPREGVFLRYYDAAQKGVPVYVEEFNEEACIAHYKFLSTLPGLAEEMKTYAAEGIPLPTRQFDNAAFFKYGYILFVTYEDVSSQHDILIRFAKEFEQTYTRFLDLQKAESQAREAKIEAALEKVRARTMGMQQSEELAEVAILMFQQIKLFGLESWGCGFNIWDKEEKECTGWMSGPGTSLIPPVRIPLTEHPLFIRFFESRKKGEDFWVQEMGGDELRGLYQYMDKVPVLGDQLRQAQEVGISPPTSQINHVVNFLHGNLIFITYEPCPEAHDIFKRFGKVFEQTYTRFLDLQKAEAQARESQIQLALERVRARTMAMHVSNEVHDVARTISDQLRELGCQGNCTIALIDGVTGDMEWWTGGFEGKGFLNSYLIQNFDHAVHRAIVDGFNQGEKFKSIHASGELKKTYDANLFFENGFRHAPDAGRNWMLSLESADFSLAYNKHGALHFAPFPITDEQAIILQRFASVFEQTYTRFLDLKKAEELAREAQIEVALERVRARAMAMHTTQELKEVVHELRIQIGLLGDADLDTFAIHLNDESPDFVRAWAGSRLGDEFKEFVLEFPKKGLALIEEALEHYYNGERDYQIVGNGTKVKQWWDYVFGVLPEAHEFFAGTSATDETLTGFMSFADFQGGSMIMSTLEQPDQDSLALLRRFSNVFGLAYRRFADLKQAEAQAREAQIEAALERVRSRTMAMRQSSELSEVASLMFRQFSGLGVVGWTAGFNVWSDDNNSYTDYVVDPQGEIMEPYVVDTTQFSVFIEIAEARKRGDELFVQYVEGERLVQGYQHLSRFANKGQFQKILSGGNAFPTKQYDHFVFGTKVSLIFITYEPVPEFHDVFKRFGRVFEQTYTRFLDLQKAEAQAREAQIEAALEKIRSRSLGMHKSGEIKDVVSILFDKLKELGLEFDGRASIHLFSEGSKDAYVWVVSHGLPEPVRIDLPFDEVEFRDNPTIIDVWRAKETGAHIINRVYSKKEKDKYFRYVFKYNGNKLSDALKESIISADNYTVSFIAEKNSLLGATSWSEQKFSESDVEVLKRVAHVFEQAYIRFLDLQKAEAQAHEAIIETALEKIRSRSLGMHRSEEILDVVAILFEKLKELGLTFDGGAAIHLFSKGTKDMSIWVVTEGADPVYNLLPYDEKYADSPIMQDLISAAETGTHIINRCYNFEEKNRYFEYVGKHNDASRVPEQVRKAIMDASSFTVTHVAERNCLLGADSRSGQTFSDADIAIFKRAARVFDQAYVRFLDLQKAEIHAKEAVRQASLDRVRAEIASMRTVQDLDRITPLIWSELTALGIPFIRCGVFIMDETNHVVHSYLSTPEGKAIAVFQLPFDVIRFVEDTVEHWRKKTMYIRHWDELTMRDFADVLVKHGIFATADQYLATSPREGYYQHFLPFAQGMLYVGNITQLKDDELNVLQSLADAFATAYARYDDFSRLELAKKQVDNALVNLKQAQQQLVQSEKMASLGELTAGIAHEIQNPLNFVNNFSEVSHELMDEIKAEIEAGNLQAAADLVNDIKQNLQKITHHGKRADGIVKGMLQHSRTGSGQKEPTNINVLCDEYVRLAYHGYRAKDKSFNAIPIVIGIETDFDSNLPKVNVIAQDIGRVILNLINNAYYAVNERSAVAKAMADTSADAKASTDEAAKPYEPSIMVSTKRLNDKIEIRVRDNGNGIPETNREKIFQPFFTTKPTGSGTGLGLSLSYDIVKAHGGTLKVDSTEGVGSEFIIHLPS